MKFFEVFRFEISYQLRRAWPWMIVVILMSLVFLFMRDGSFSEALYTEFFINSPFMIAMATVFGSLLWLLTAAFITGEAAARDMATGMHSLLYTTSIKKLEYLGGRFLAAFVVHACILLTVQLTILLSIYLPGVHPDSIGPFRPEAFLTAYFFIAFPNAFAATAIQFALAMWTGRPITAYIGSLSLFFTAFFIAALILFRSGLGTLLDPIGVRFVWDELSHLWTTVEKSHRLLELNGTLLQNRLVWISFGLAVMAATYLQFQFRHRVVKNFRFKILDLRFLKPRTGNRVLDTNWSSGNLKFQILKFKPASGFSLFIRQTITIAWTSFRTLATSGTGLVMLIFIPLMAIPVVIDQMVALSVPLVPTTARVVKELTGPLSADMSRWMVIPGFIIFFAGELIWRERENRLAEITDTMPGSEWAPMLGKFFGLSLLLLAFTTTLTLAGMLSQLLMDYSNFELSLYLKIMFGLQLPEYLLFAMLTLFVHTFVNQKYIGHLVAIIAYAFIAAVATMLGIEHNLLIYGAGPVWSYTEMRGFGPFIGPWLVFKIYWAAWALMLAVVTTLFWARGRESGFNFRLRLARRRFTSTNVRILIVAGILVISSGGYIFYNTNILNSYVNSTEAGQWHAEYEKRYGRYENSKQPELTSAKVHIEIYPERRAVEIKGSYQLVNHYDTPIDSIHVSTSAGGAKTTSMTLNKNATIAVDDNDHRYRIYKLESPLLPDDSVLLDFTANVEPHGFRNGGIDPSITAEGSHFTNESWFPSIGFQRKRGIINPAQRREYGLEPRPVIASLNEAHGGEALSLGGGISFEAIVGTNEDQVAIAPGDQQSTWTENGRRYFHYKTSAPIGSEWAFFSSKYDVYEKQWVSPNDESKKVTIRVFHYPKHTAHVEHMMQSVTDALRYYSEQFGPYRYTHLHIVEHPIGPGTGAHADPSMISHGQGYADWLEKNPNRLDFPFAVMGHEMGHQWTLPYAMIEGLPFLSEGLAWHYGIMLVKATRGPSQTRQLMSFMRQPYPHQPIRRGEPLLRALDPYLAYKRGPLAMYALGEYAGFDRVNRAIRNLVAKSRVPGAHPTTTMDLYRELKAEVPDSLQTMLREFFEVNTLWQFQTKSVKAIKVKDNWQVTLNVNAKKIVYDSAGVETEMPMNDWIQIGVFTNRQPGMDELSSPLYLEKHRIRPGDQTITITVTGRPVLAGIDPHHLLDWEEKEDDDNIEAVGQESGAGN